MITAAVRLDTPLAASLDCGHAAMTHVESEARLIERLKASDADGFEPLMGRLRSLLLDELRRGRP
jgi:hypothetical protein